jgi:PAS domain S-box-containing protein
MRNNLKPKSTIEKSYLDLEIINKFESLEEFPITKPVMIVNPEGTIIYTNKSIESTFGFANGSNLFELNSEPNLQKLFIKLDENNITSFCTDLLIQIEEDFFSSYLLNIEKVNLEGDDIYIIYLDSQNNRKRITKKVNSFNQAIEAVNVGILIADENANVQHISTSFENFFSIRIDQIYNKNFVSAFRKYLTEYEINELEVSIIQKKTWVKVISEIDNEGDVKYKEIRMNVIEDNIDNTFNFIITANDITKHIQQARLIKKSEQRQKSIINNISDPILILRKEKGDLIFENANNTFYSNILGKKVSVHENSVLEFINPVLHSIIHEAIKNLEDTNRVHVQFHYTVPINNQRFLGKVTYTDDQYDNTRLYIINMTDITEQLEIEKKLRDAYKKEISLNKLKSTFLANMSHEIRTPLNAIVGYSDLLEDDVKAMNYESSAKMTTYLKDGVNRLLKLVDNIVEVSLLESGNQDFSLDNVNLNQILLSNKNIWTEQAALSNLALKYELCNSDIFIEANEDKLDRALKELVDNAIKYNQEKGSVIINTSKKDEEIVLQIIDTGIGIEKESLNKIFHLFEQVEEVGYTRKYEGAGLGLSLANKLVSFMNGNMKIVSEPNKGTIITISFPQK